MYYVYRIRSKRHRGKSFIGTTRDVSKRLRKHNNGLVEATREHGPWRISFYAAFTRKERAAAFEDYLKSPAGKEFGRKYLWNKISKSDSV